MDALTIKTNLPEVTTKLQEVLAKLGNKEYLPRLLAFGVIDKVTNRIHIEGEASDGGQIGTYNSRYLKLREEKYNRKSDTKIIVSLTRQLENDWAVLATDKGYGIGFNNAFNKQKAKWVEERKDRTIFSLTTTEQEYIQKTAQELVTNAFT
jgi:hypothetical protein